MFNAIQNCHGCTGKARMRRCTFLIAAIHVALLASGCGDTEVWPEADIVGPSRTLPPPPAGSPSPTPTVAPDDGPSGPPDPDDLDLSRYPTTASEWGQRLAGVRTRLDTGEPVVAITLDACAGPGGIGYDSALIDLLV